MAFHQYLNKALRRQLSFLSVSHRLPQSILFKRNMSSSNSNDLRWIEKVYELVMQQKLVAGHYERENSVINFVQPEELTERLGGLEIKEQPNPNAEAVLENVVKYSVKTCHARFFNQLYHGSDPAGLAGQVSIITIHKVFIIKQNLISVAK